MRIWSTYLGSLKNLVNTFGGLRKWPDMITPVIKVNEFPPPPGYFLGVSGISFRFSDGVPLIFPNQSLFDEFQRITLNYCFYVC